ncbi:MAG: ATP-binding protein [Opitutaceae bacterium]|nr:ATP-binding protein [Opitutaceae bacterium]
MLRSWKQTLIIFFLTGMLMPLCLGGERRETGRLVMRSFGTQEIHAKGPALALAETDDGSMFVGSNHLVIFDGLGWQRIDIPEAYAFRALDASLVAGGPIHHTRVWVGAVGAIGYVERNLQGLWSFTSLVPQLQAAGLPVPNEVWLVKAVGQGAIFVSAHRVWRWDGTRFESWILQSGLPLKAVADETGGVWIYQAGVGLLHLGEGGAPRLVRPTQTLPPGSIDWMLPPINKGDQSGTAARTDLPSTEGMLVGTTDGIYRLTADGSELLPALSEYLNGQATVQAVAVEGGDVIAIRTVRNGVVLATRQGDVIMVVNQSSGLSSDTVYFLWSDRRGAIWLGLDGGCVRLDSVDIVSLFDTRNGLKQGLPRKVVTQGEVTYVLTDKELYQVTDSAPEAARLIPIFSQAMFSDAVSSSDGLWIGSNHGLWRIDHEGASHQMTTVGEGACFATVPWFPQGFLYTDAHGLKSFALPSHGGAVQDFGVKINDLPVSLVADDRGDLWLSTATDGIIHFQIRPDENGPTLVPAEHFRENDGLPGTAGRPVLTRVGPRLFAFTETQILVLDPTRGFVPAPEFSGWQGVAGASVGPPPPATRDGSESSIAYWLAKRCDLQTDSPAYALLRVSYDQDGGGTLRWEPLLMAGLDTIGEVTSLDVTRLGGENIMWIGGEGGLLRARLDRIRLSSTPRSLQLREVRVRGKSGGMLELHPKKTATIGPSFRSVTFGFTAAQPMEVTPVAIYYQTRLQPIETEWTPPRRNNTREFTGLAPGSYVFMAQRVDRYGRSGEPATYSFEIVAPWYRRWPAVIIYVVFGGFVVAGLLRWRLQTLQRQTERLDRLVAQRTRELELSSTAKSEFLENISHEIRNPLNGIVGLANLLKPERLLTEDKEVLRSLKASADHLRRVTEDVLGFSKLEFGSVAVEEKAFRLGQALREVVAQHEASARQWGSRISLILPPGAEDCFVGDEGKIRTIIGNFLSNAVKYAPGKPVEIRADWTDDEDASTQVFIAVTDRGPGVPANEQELIFQKYVRGSIASAHGVTGSGIGLAMCRMLARRMGGIIGVESPLPVSEAETNEAGPGASFHLWLPLKRTGSLLSSATAKPLTVPPTDTKTTSTTATALILDDEEYNRIVLAGLARELGYEPLLAGDAASSLAVVGERLIDVMFIDLELQGSKGYDTARLLRQLPGGKNAVIIATTGRDSDEARRRCQQAGMNGFLLKPFEGEQVREVIRRVREERGAGCVPGASPPPGPLSPKVAPGGNPPILRALQLYAQGANQTVVEAARRYGTAVDQEIAIIQQGLACEDRPALAAAGHRLRTLGALVQARSVNEAARLLEERALTLSQPELAELVNQLVSDTAQLKEALRQACLSITPGGPD